MCHVEWLDSARNDVRRDLIPQFEKELQQAFPEAVVITVCHCLAGYSKDQERKIILGAQIRSADDYRVHTVKLGDQTEVAADFTGWQKCLLRSNVASHVFLRVERRPLTDPKRLAIVYEDAYTFFGLEQREAKAQNLEAVARGAVEKGEPDVLSVERVIRQIFCELARCLYRDALPSVQAASEFYRRKLHPDDGKRPNVHVWRDDIRRSELRKDLIWLLCGLDIGKGVCQCVYLDPYDYVCWALHGGELPRTLVGRSHGDLHGRNILVGVERGEAEFPLIFDYGNMDDQNALVWDFAKLETELKVRLLLPLYMDVSARNALLSQSKFALPHHTQTKTRSRSTNGDARIIRINQLAFAFEFESLLAKQSFYINQINYARSPNPPIRHATRNEKVDRALGVILRIRQEAAIHLGELQRYHGSWELWRDEYNFALAAYGLCTAKFDYLPFESGFALVSAGVAAAHVSSVNNEILDLVNRAAVPPGPYPCYGVALAHAHRLWKSGAGSAIKEAVGLLEGAAKTYAHAVPLIHEYALVLLEAGKHHEALHLLQPLEEDAELFGDHETLSRIGRAWKDQGDHALEKNVVSAEELAKGVPKHAAWQFYHTAYRPYKAAYDIGRHYYPGVNLATLAYLLGHHKESKMVAEEVLQSCSTMVAPDGDWFWILATEGEASLLTGQPAKAAAFYEQALQQISPSEAGMAQSAYAQVCRLWWALGRNKVMKVLKVFKAFPDIWEKLKPGPLGDCGHARS